MAELTHVAPELISAATCAALAGCKQSTWRAYVANKTAPPPRGWRHQDGLRGWDPAEVLAWLAARPGSGNHAKGRKRTAPRIRVREYSLGGEPARRDVPSRSGWDQHAKRPAMPADAPRIEELLAG